jgi:NADH:ubiquinone oxidoreductase subunit F (NADH-binding)
VTTTFIQPLESAGDTGRRPSSPVPHPTEVTVLPGPALLAGVERGPSLGAHRDQHGPLPMLSADALIADLERIQLCGRGGAGFPFVTKLRALGSGRPVLVVNLSEGEPASGKDSALALTRPHLVLDGVVVTARALAAREVHVVLPGERPMAAAAMRSAIAERDDPVRVLTRTAEPRFVAGQARAVVELLAGRPNLPRTSWAPEAVSGHEGRPTLLSNAETWARIGLLALRGAREYARIGTPAEPGATLLTVGSPGSVPVIHELPYGGRVRELVPEERHGRPILVGGFHGSWATWPTVASLRLSVPRMRSLGTPLGAGVLLSLGADDCPVDFTRRVVAYLAGQSAGRCGPCFNGLPALAEAVAAVGLGRGGTGRVEELARLVVRRGACAHPDGTVRLVRSLLSTFAGEVAAHADGGCAWAVGREQLVGVA